MSRTPTVAVSLGDPYGVGPEVVAKAVCDLRVRRALRPVVYGDRSVLERAAKVMRARLPARLEVVSLTELGRAGFRFGKPTASSGRAALAYLDEAIDAVLAGKADALCTAPIHKLQMSRVGFGFPGHTDYLRERFGATQVVMMLAGPTLRVALATVHLPLSKVSRALTVAGLLTTLEIVHQALRRHFGSRNPRIGVCGVNPHAGEGGLLGTEELRIVGPAMRKARAKGIRADGPFPADSLFARQIQSREFDAILAMHHDQGLGPLKAVDFDRAVNVTLGLPRPRTSPDHGTAFDIAGKGVANATSMIEALLLAGRLVS